MRFLIAKAAAMIITAAPLVVGVATSAAAQGVTITDCAISESAFEHRMVAGDCSITNGTDTAIASLTFSAKVTEDGRSVPWIEFDAGLAEIAGGIEPGETIQQFFTYGRKPRHASFEGLVPSVVFLEAFDINGEKIPTRP